VLLDSRRRAFQGQIAQLRERIAQINLEIEGAERQRGARERQLELLASELRDLEQLFARNLVPLSRVSILRRDFARLQGDIGVLNSDSARLGARVAETELLIIQAEQQNRTEINQDFREVASRLAELNERKTILEDTLNRVEIRSPAKGVVHQLTITPNGVVRPGETIMRIVPSDETLVFEARVQPRDIDQVRVGQEVSIRLLAANQAVTQAIAATVESVAPDIVIEPATQARYFVVKVRAPQEAIASAKTTRLVPGMPVDLFIRTDDRTPMSYLLKPLFDQMARAFRER
jgi:HlyD family secretion protein